MDIKKNDRYQRLYDQLVPLMTKTKDAISKMATINAICKNKISYFFWCGFYFFTDEYLLVGPYQGPVACLQLQKPNGVCWKAVMDRKTVVVKNVHDFPGHIACDSRSLSEIVVPVFSDSEKLYAVLDADSDKLESFDQTDALWLGKIVTDFLTLPENMCGTKGNFF